MFEILKKANLYQERQWLHINSFIFITFLLSQWLLLWINWPWATLYNSGFLDKNVKNQNFLLNLKHLSRKLIQNISCLPFNIKRSRNMSKFTKITFSKANLKKLAKVDPTRAGPSPKPDWRLWQARKFECMSENCSFHVLHSKACKFFFAQSPSWSGMCRCPANTPPLARFALLQFGARRRFEPNRAPSKFCSPDFWSRSECTLRNATAIWRKFCEHSDSRAHPEAKACARTVFSTASRRYGKIRQQSRARSLRTADPKTQCKGFWKIKL